MTLATTPFPLTQKYFLIATKVKDLHVLEVLGRGEFCAFGMQNRDVRCHLEGVSSAAMSRIFKRLSLHGLICRQKGSLKYFLTEFGKSVVVAGLHVRNQVIIPALL